MSFFGDVYRIAWADIRYMRLNIFAVLLSVMMIPLLYFVSFGYGLGTRVTDMEGVSYVAFVIPGIISMSTLSSCFSFTANKIMIQREFYASFDEILLCPVSPSAVVVGKGFGGFLRGVLSASLLIILGFILSPDMALTIPMIACILLSCFTFSMLGVLGGFVCNGTATMNLFNSVVILPMTFLSGTVFTVSAMPKWIAIIVNCLPLTHVTNCIRSSALSWDFPWVSLAVMIFFGLTFFSIARWLLVTRRI